MAVFRRRWPGLSYGRGEDWHYVGEAGEPAFANSWVNAGPGQQLGFRIRESGIVDVQGVVKDGTVDAAVFTLPSDYRPSNIIDVPIVAYDLGASSWVAGLLTVNASGAVSAYISTNDEVHITGQFFLDPAVAP